MAEQYLKPIEGPTYVVNEQAPKAVSMIAWTIVFTILHNLN